MVSFTFGTAEARAAVIDAARAEGEPFTATYNLNDSRTIFRALRHVSVLSDDMKAADVLASMFAQHIPSIERDNNGRIAVVWSADELRVVLDALCEYTHDDDNALDMASDIASLYDVEWV